MKKRLREAEMRADRELSEKRERMDSLMRKKHNENKELKTKIKELERKIREEKEQREREEAERLAEEQKMVEEEIEMKPQKAEGLGVPPPIPQNNQF